MATTLVGKSSPVKSRLKEYFYYLAGLLFLALAKAKHVLRGYDSPKSFSIDQSERCYNYDIEVVDQWLLHLRRYLGEQNASATQLLRGKNVLELGPGSDLGIGLYLLYLGADQYNACDVNNLARTVPAEFYQGFLEKLRKLPGSQGEVAELQVALQETRTGQPSALNYVVRPDFNLIAAFGAHSMDLVFSQAAFEHFDDIDATVSQLSALCRPGAVIVAEVDLKTHSRWIRQKDPNNIYRYSGWLYRLFWFRGAPNRQRPFQYKEAFERHGWENVQILPLATAPEAKCLHYTASFQDGRNQMEYLSIMICARKKPMA